MSKNSLLLYISWLTALVATLGSLYFSEVRQVIPCDMCWYQRIAMYPLVILLGMATFRSDIEMKRYALPFSVIGMGLSSLHYAEQKIESFGGMAPCQSGVPCDGEYINWLGFITIPFLALIAFVIITVCLLLIQTGKKNG